MTSVGASSCPRKNGQNKSNIYVYLFAVFCNGMTKHSLFLFLSLSVGAFVVAAA